MAGSYNHIVTRKGNLGSNEHVVNMLENGGDVFEAVEEMFGMIWYLAGDVPHVPQEFMPAAAKARVEAARQNYKQGLKLSKIIHKVLPDTPRGGDDE